MKRSLIIIIGIVAISIITLISTTTLANQKEENEEPSPKEEIKQHNLKLVYESNYVLDEMLNENFKVIIEYENQKIDNFNISKNEIITLEELKIPDSKVISYWDIQENENQYIITPVVVAENEINVKFATTNGGMLEDKKILPSMIKTVEKGTKLNDIIPDVQNKDGFHFAGWFTIEDIEKEVEIKEEEREDIKELNTQIEKKEKDLSKEDDDKKKKGFEKDIKKLKEDLKNAKEETKIETEIVKEYQLAENIGNIELEKDNEYIAVLYPDSNDNKKDDRKEEINLSIDFGLGNEVHEEKIHVGQPIKLSKPYHEEYIFIDWFTDSGFKEKYEPENIPEKDTSIYAQWKTPSQIVSESGESLIHEERISDKVESYLNETNKEIYEQKKKDSEERQIKIKEDAKKETAQHTEKSYTLRNFKIDQSYLIKFYDDETFLYSVALPYGRTLELLDGNGNKIKEYGIRQESSIDLNNFVNNSENINFDIKAINKNNAVITQIYPKNNKKEID